MLSVASGGVTGTRSAAAFFAVPIRLLAGIDEASQMQWLACRDAQIGFINSCYDQYDGFMYGPMRASAEMEVTRARARDLVHGLEMHKEHAKGSE